MLNVMKRFVKEEEGLELVEYAIMAALLVVGLVAAITGLGTSISDKFTDIGTEIDDAGTTP
ncbi:MAG: Flp family type IVb pilin [Phycisphaeraceae bacterium]